MTWKVCGSTHLPLGDREREWDEQGARDRIFRWAGWEDDPHPKKAQKAFFAYDDDKETNLTAYKLPFADVVGGELQAMPRGLFAEYPRQSDDLLSQDGRRGSLGRRAEGSQGDAGQADCEQTPEKRSRGACGGTDAPGARHAADGQHDTNAASAQKARAGCPHRGADTPIAFGSTKIAKDGSLLMFVDF